MQEKEEEEEVKVWGGAENLLFNYTPLPGNHTNFIPKQKISDDDDDEANNNEEEQSKRGGVGGGKVLLFTNVRSTINIAVTHHAPIGRVNLQATTARIGLAIACQ
ncbi:hypothetical protein T4E_2854 [Trichinella pseudospiralis]|uniref:Uncharacterized protein n=1 Tax=Trichinella pseudospiralis TaxID=6337 RepID=A0A0V0XWK6_TRIPS|nr:hypothetical protein T4E_2854 [Trichinella pseudospiralis]